MTADAASTQFFIPTKTLTELNAKFFGKIDGLLTWLTKWAEYGVIKNEDPYVSVAVDPVVVTEKQNEELKTRFEVTDATTVIEFKAKLMDAKTLLAEMTGRIQAANSIESKADKVEITAIEKAALEKYHVFSNQRLRIHGAEELVAKAETIAPLITVADYKKLVASLHEKLKHNYEKKVAKEVSRDKPFSSGQFIMREILLRAAVKAGFVSFSYPVTEKTRHPEYEAKAKALGFSKGYEEFHNTLFGSGGTDIQPSNIGKALKALGIRQSIIYDDINRRSLNKEIDAEYQQWQKAFAAVADTDDKKTIIDSTLFLQPEPQEESMRFGDDDGSTKKPSEPAAGPAAGSSAAAETEVTTEKAAPPPEEPAATPNPAPIEEATDPTSARAPKNMDVNFFTNNVTTKEKRQAYVQNLRSFCADTSGDLKHATRNVHPHALTIKFIATLINDVLGDKAPEAIASFASEPQNYIVTKDLVDELNKALNLADNSVKRLRVAKTIEASEAAIAAQFSKIQDYLGELQTKASYAQPNKFSGHLMDFGRHLKQLVYFAYAAHNITDDDAPAAVPSAEAKPAAKGAAAPRPMPANAAEVPAGMDPDFYAANVVSGLARTNFVRDLNSLATKIESNLLKKPFHPHAPSIKFIATVLSALQGKSANERIAKFAQDTDDNAINPELINDINHALGFTEHDAKRFVYAPAAKLDSRVLTAQMSTIRESFIRSLGDVAEYDKPNGFISLLLDPSRYRMLASLAHDTYPIKTTAAAASPAASATPARSAAAAGSPVINGKTTTDILHRLNEVLGVLEAAVNQAPIAKAKKSGGLNAKAKSTHNYSSIVAARFAELIATEFLAADKKVKHGVDFLQGSDLLNNELSGLQFGDLIMALDLEGLPRHGGDHFYGTSPLKHERAKAELKTIKDFIAKLDKLRTNNPAFRALLLNPKELAKLFVS